MTERAVILMPFIRSGFDTDVFHAILIRVKIKIFYQGKVLKLNAKRVNKTLSHLFFYT